MVRLDDGHFYDRLAELMNCAALIRSFWAECVSMFSRGINNWHFWTVIRHGADLVSTLATRCDDDDVDDLLIFCRCCSATEMGNINRFKGIVDALNTA